MIAQFPRTIPRIAPNSESLRSNSSNISFRSFEWNEAPYHQLDWFQQSAGQHEQYSMPFLSKESVCKPFRRSLQEVCLLLLSLELANFLSVLTSLPIVHLWKYFSIPVARFFHFWCSLQSLQNALALTLLQHRCDFFAHQRRLPVLLYSAQETLEPWCKTFNPCDGTSTLVRS